MDEKQESVTLNYTIHKFSSYSANYVPDNIMVNKPVDQLSRWFTDSSTQSQFIILKLKSPCIVETIKFGKFIKAHVSNLKKFQVLGGTEETNLSLLLSAGLKNDSTAEVFRLRHKTQEGLYLPITYLKIVPLQSWGPAYNYTIWYVELTGKNQDDLVTTALETINLRKEEEAVRLLLKHLRRRRYKDAFEALSRESGVKLEGPVQARLWNTLVENGDFKMAEKIFQEAAADGELDWYLSWQPYTPVWRQMCPCSAQVEARLGAGEPRNMPKSAPPSDLHSHERDNTEALPGVSEAESPEPSEGASCGAAGCCGKPGPRGGHQLVVDSTTGTLYLFGGWNGTEDLDDLWSYSTTDEQWNLLCRHSHQIGGPSPRSCHKMVFDPTQRKLYTLGRYLDNAQRVPSNMKGDLYSYDVCSNTWSLVCGDTAAAGGPRLVFDHQMCIDADTQTVYVFGGRVLPANTEESASPQYSGLYAYYIRTDTWQLLLADRHTLAAPQPRVSHSMLFHPVARRLYMFAGQRNKEHLVDLWWWDVGTYYTRTDTWQLLLADRHTLAAPQPRVSHSMLFHPVARRLYMFAGQRNKEHLVDLWWWDVGTYYTRTDTWQLLLADRHTLAAPQPRVSHSMLFHPVARRLYMFAGQRNKEHLVDLWWWDVGTYYTRTDTWQLLLADRHTLAAPQPRVSHSMLFHPVARRLYMFAGQRNKEHLVDLWWWDVGTYYTRTDTWQLLLADRHTLAAPQPRVSHSMLFHPVARRLYMFAGQRNKEHLVDLWWWDVGTYYTRTDTWQLLLADRHTLAAPQLRVSHSMLFHPVARRLYMFAGQRNKEHLVDLWWWDVATGECRALCMGCAPPPQAGFTQRATLDPDTDEMYVLSGMSKEKDRGVYNTMWVFSLRRLTWSCVYRNERAGPHEPRPRFAHQLVFDPVTKTHYLFGGNPGKQSSPRLRLDDLWSLRLTRPTTIEVIRSAKASIREAAYRALCVSPRNQLVALEYLRSELNEVMDHSDPTQVARFQKLATVLFSGCGAASAAPRACVALTPQRARALAARRAGGAAPADLAHALSVVLGAEDTMLEPIQPFEETSIPEPETWEVGRDEDSAAPSDEWVARHARMQLYDQLVTYFRPSTVPPTGDITDLVAL